MFILDCHALNRVRNDSCALPLEDFAASCICMQESFILDCHALQARNDAIALPLEDFASFIIESLECLSVLGVCHHEP
ncbi:MAG: hypothetical protein K9G11_02760 [Rickettsiaceae bacterium]|nr:hypothetical protein [Rickettsiaceae bacterium]